MAAVFIPLAVAICFGLIYGTILVLFVIPALLSSVLTINDWLDKNNMVIHSTRNYFLARQGCSEVEIASVGYFSVLLFRR